MVELDKSAPGSSPPSPPIAERGALAPSPSLKPWHKPVFILFLLFWLGNVVLAALGIDFSPVGPWLEAGLILLATASSLLALGRRLPLQNVIATGALITAISSAVVALAGESGIPLGPIQYSVYLGEKVFGALPWSLPLGWVFLIVNGRGVARLMMRPWRKTNYYGFWVIGLTCLLAVLFDVGFEPFAVYVKDYWIWQTPKPVLAWYTAPWVNFLGWFVIALAVLTFAMPWLINKQPVKQAVDYQPLVLWLMLSVWVGVGNAMHHLWPAVVVSVIGNGVAALYAVRGARW